MKVFNTATVCIPNQHYMVDLSNRVNRIIQQYIEPGKYFSINRGRQYGKTTTMFALAESLRAKYYVLQLSFEWADDFFESDYQMVTGFRDMVTRELRLEKVPNDLISEWGCEIGTGTPFTELDNRITSLCRNSDKEIILMIDEVDRASNNKTMMLFLGLLRDKYIRRSQGRDCTFKSVILSGVYDVKSLKMKIRPEEDKRFNSPWNVAVDFDVEMSFSADEITAMLEEYRSDYSLSFDAAYFGREIYDYTSGYPYLVSRLCEILDLKIPQEAEFDSKEKSWTAEGFQRAVHIFLEESNTLLEDLTKKLDENADLKKLVYEIIVMRHTISFNRDDNLIRMGIMFGWFKNENGKVAIANRIFEVRIYNKLLLEKTSTKIYKASDVEKYKLKSATELDMDAIVERFAVHFKTIYADRTSDFIEDEARIIFLTFLKPIINGVGNYYLEAEIADKSRTDIVVDYHGQQYIIEIKIWHGESYETAGKEQLCGYLDKYGLKKGWLISFCFNKNKSELIGTYTHEIQDKIVSETVV